MIMTNRTIIFYYSIIDYHKVMMGIIAFEVDTTNSRKYKIKDSENSTKFFFIIFFLSTTLFKYVIDALYSTVNES